VPFVDLAVAINDDAGGLYGTLLARTDFSALWNAVISLRIGETGYAYIVQDDGQILAYRDFQVVQRGSSLIQLTGKAPKTIAESDFTFYTGIEDQYAIAAAAPVSATPWYVVIEQAVTESLFAFGLLTLGLLVLLVIVIWQASSAIGFTQRRIVTPLGRMQAAAEEIQQENFGTRLEVHAEDELGNLAHTFNTMTSHIQGLVDSLEQRVAERTDELEGATRQSQELATRLKAIADVGRSVSSIQDLDRLLTEITKQISNTFGFYHAGVFLIDTSGANAKLSAANSPGGQKMLSRGHSLKVGQVGIVGYVAEKGAPRIALDVGEDAVFFNNPDLPETRSEIALPLKSGETIIGVLDVQSTEPNAFSDKDAETLSILADQVAIAIQNARLFDETRKALIEADALQRQYARSSWARLATNIQQIGYRYSVTGAAPLEKPTNLPEIQKAAESGKTIIDTQQPTSSMSIQLKLRGETIGVLNVRIPDRRAWEQDEIDVAEAIAERLALALENARLFEETTKRAARERTVSEITTKIRSKNDPESMIQTALAELRQILGASQVEILHHSESPTAVTGLKKST
jgi:GAF domain-containing protein/HAMP domain-containing protein